MPKYKQLTAQDIQAKFWRASPSLLETQRAKGVKSVKKRFTGGFLSEMRIIVKPFDTRGYAGKKKVRRVTDLNIKW